MNWLNLIIPVLTTVAFFLGAATERTNNPVLKQRQELLEECRATALPEQSCAVKMEAVVYG